MKELSKNLMCISLMSGKEIWVESDRVAGINRAISETSMIEIDGNTINRSILEGIFKPDIMANWTRKKNGEWKCKYGTWHKKFEECNCKPVINEFEKTKELYKPAERKNSHEHNMETLKNCINKKI